MDEPPAKRPRRDREQDIRDTDTTSPRSPRVHESRGRHDDDGREVNGHARSARAGGDTRDEERKHKRSRSPRGDKYNNNGDGPRRRERSRDRDRSYRDRDRNRDRDRERRDRDRDRDHRPRRSRSRSRSHSPLPSTTTTTTNGSTPALTHQTATAGIKRPRSPPPRRTDHDRNHNSKFLKKEHPTHSTSIADIKPTPQQESEDEETYLRRIMGFAGFRSTKNTKVPGNQIYAVRKEKKTTYRQYMNRVGGFNRPLSPSR